MRIIVQKFGGTSLADSGAQVLKASAVELAKRIFGRDVMVWTLEVYEQMDIQPEHYFSSLCMSFAIERQRAAQAVNKIHGVLIDAAQSVARSWD